MDQFPEELPPRVLRYAPWRWHWMDLLGYGITIGAALSFISLILWYLIRIL